VALPWLILLPLGLLWLWQQGGLLWWLGGAVVISLAAWAARGWWRRGETVQKPGFAPDPHWSYRDEAVWVRVEQQASALRLDDFPLDGRMPHRLLDLGLDTLRVVARHYHPDAREPELHIDLPRVLLSVERICRDLRRLTDYVPLSDRVTLAQWKRAPGLMKLAQLYDVWRLARLALNPASALINEARGVLQGKLFSQTRDELLLWLLQEYVKGTGRHAIELYSGQLLLDDGAVTGALDLADQAPESAPEEPFRVLVLGQVSSGKSSLINALFGELRAATDVLALTRGFAAYRLERDGAPVALILDSQGYAGGDAPDATALDRELLRADLILLVCAAHHAARAADHAQLKQLRRLFRDQPQRHPPALLCALTFVDRLRPVREWSPPYDIVEPVTPKARSIRAAVDHLAATLALDPAHIVPVRADAGRVYNIDEALMPRILESLADDAARARYLRCLRHRQQTGHWQRLLRQTRNAGRLLATAGGRLGNRTLQKGRDWLDEWR
jgi:uncharacterized protein